MTTSNRGFAKMDKNKQHKAAQNGGKAQGAESNPENFANNRKKASDAGAKSRGGGRSA